MALLAGVEWLLEQAEFKGKFGGITPQILMGWHERKAEIQQLSIALREKMDATDR